MHVLLSALVTTAMFTLHSRRSLWATIAIGYVGSVGIATLSNCLIPYVGDPLLDLPNRGLHLGFIEKWWLVNPLAAAGILWGYLWPRTKIAHAGHVLLSTWASLFHVTMAMGAASVSCITRPQPCSCSWRSGFLAAPATSSSLCCLRRSSLTASP